MVYSRLSHMLTYPSITKMWSADLRNTHLGQNGRPHITHKSSISCYSQENNFKISRWYRDPSTQHKIFPTTPASCWHCGAPLGTYLHVRWECEQDLTLLESVFQVYNAIYKESLQPTPEIALSMLQDFFLSAVRQLVPL